MTILQPQGADTSDADRTGGGLSAGGPAGATLKVFISYRREDTQIAAWMLYSRLTEQFGAENVFFDRGALRPGMQWFAEIKSHLACAHAFIVHIALGESRCSALSEPVCWWRVSRFSVAG